MLQIQAKIKIVNERNKVDNTKEYVGEEATDEEVQKVNIENGEEIKILTLDNLKKLELPEIQKDKKFIVNYENEEVYYIDGYETKEGNILYSLTDINNLAIK